MSVFDKHGAPIEPDALVAAGRCPECGDDLADLDIEDHIVQHWPGVPSLEATRRIELLHDHAKRAAAKKPD